MRRGLLYLRATQTGFEFRMWALNFAAHPTVPPVKAGRGPAASRCVLVCRRERPCWRARRRVCTFSCGKIVCCALVLSYSGGASARRVFRLRMRCEVFAGFVVSGCKRRGVWARARRQHCERELMRRVPCGSGIYWHHSILRVAPLTYYILNLLFA